MTEIPRGPVPRGVPLLTRLAVLFGGTLSQVGWVVVFFSMIFVWPFAPSSLAELRPRDWSEQRGRVVLAEETNASVNERSVWGYVYEYDVDGVTFSGRAFTTGKSFDQGQDVAVEVALEQPAVSRLVGARPSKFPTWAALLTLAFPVPGAVVLAIALRRNVRSLRLLHGGQFAAGRPVHKAATNVTINDQQVYKYTFEFTTRDGRSARVVGRTHTSRLEDEEYELILYPERDPERGVVYDAIPNAPVPMPDGSLAPLPASTIRVAILPALTLLVHGGMLWLWIR